MSEYQYYEFQAIERSLTPAEMAELRRLSSRATITSRLFTNEYHFGDFRGNPREVMARYFDAHVYLSNFGCRAVHFRLPKSAMDLRALLPFRLENGVEIRETDSHLVLSFHSVEEPGRDSDVFDEEPGDVLPKLLPIRDSLASGDLRPLYLGWLAGVQNGHVADDDLEPPVPAGLGQLDAALTDFSDFLWLEPQLVQVAARSSAVLPEERLVATLEARAWVAGRSPEEKDDWLVRLLESADGSVPLEIRGRFAAARRAAVSELHPGGRRRTAGELRAQAEALAAEWRAAEEQRRAAKRAEEERRRIERRQRHLAGLKGSEPKLWRSVELLTEASAQSSYDMALETLLDLRDLAVESGDEAGFRTRLLALRELRRRKVSLIARLDRKGLK